MTESSQETEMGMEPHNLDVVAQMGADTAQRSEEGMQKAREFKEGFQQGYESRSQSFQEGTLAGR